MPDSEALVWDQKAEMLRLLEEILEDLPRIMEPSAKRDYLIRRMEESVADLRKRVTNPLPFPEMQCRITK